jgi:hypothetical protein
MKKMTPSEKIIIYKEAYLLHLRDTRPFVNYVEIIYDLGDLQTGVTEDDLRDSELVRVKPGCFIAGQCNNVYALNMEAATIAALLHKSLSRNELKEKLISMCHRNVRRKSKNV